MPVDFIFWGSGEGEGHWALDWNSWSWKFIVERTEPIAMRFDSSIDANFDNLLSSSDNFKPAAKTKIIIHGWTENGRADWVKRMAEAYFDTGTWQIKCYLWKHNHSKYSYVNEM